MKKYLLLTSLSICSIILFAQKKQPDNWQTLDPKVDKVYGVGAEEAYKLLANKPSKTVIVAVIDGGVDPEHEDLKDVIWVNPKEIPNNDIDDDKNGYVDDINGWNFLGGKTEDINYEASELARLVHAGDKKYANVDESKLSDNELKAYKEYKKNKRTFLTDLLQKEQQLASIEMVDDFVEKIKKQNNGQISKAALDKYTPENELEKALTSNLKRAFTFGLKQEDIEHQLKEGKKSIGNTVKYDKINVDSIRQVIVGDDLNNPHESFYGNNRVKGPDALHGSHVAGIIAAMRDNNLGIKGIANNVKIMIVRAVPNGDERDKDIANAIRYAVDNGASIINMSFGKYYSPEKQLVDDAVKYAELKDVLLVHAAGNDSKNNDIEISFPSKQLLSGDVAKNWIQVGANAYKKDKRMLAPFSNYGKNTVDLFAPGFNIYSTAPDNQYINESGTSMASPSVAGAAALIRSYFPELKAEEVKAILMKTVTPMKKSLIVPGTQKEKKKLKELCISGGFVNVNNAVKELMQSNKK